MTITLHNERPYTQVRGFANFPELPRLPTKVTDAGLEHFKALFSLKWVDVRRTAKTEPGLKDLRSALPMLGYK
jgi:hypothetical protein